jgi:ribosomal protein S18 acetylase RimI-like enzyme
MELFRHGTAADVSRADAADALERVFERYYVPVAFSEAAYAIHVDANDVDLASSPIWYDGEGNVVAAAVLGVRETRGWIGGFGVAPPHRGRGVGRLLLAELLERARRLRLHSIALEVLVQNAPARRLYGAFGFSETRKLQTFEARAKEFAAFRADVPYVPGADRLIDRVDIPEPCWQLESASLRMQAGLHAVADSECTCIFRHNGETAQLLRTRASSAEAFARACASVAAQSGVSDLVLFNEPAQSSLVGAARLLAWNLVYEQCEERVFL